MLSPADPRADSFADDFLHMGTQFLELWACDITSDTSGKQLSSLLTQSIKEIVQEPIGTRSRRSSESANLNASCKSEVAEDSQTPVYDNSSDFTQHSKDQHGVRRSTRETRFGAWRIYEPLPQKRKREPRLSAEAPSAKRCEAAVPRKGRKGRPKKTRKGAGRSKATQSGSEPVYLNKVTSVNTSLGGLENHLHAAPVTSSETFSGSAPENKENTAPDIQLNVVPETLPECSSETLDEALSKSPHDSPFETPRTAPMAARDSIAETPQDSVREVAHDLTSEACHGSASKGTQDSASEAPNDCVSEDLLPSSSEDLQSIAPSDCMLKPLQDITSDPSLIIATGAESEATPKFSSNSDSEGSFSETFHTSEEISSKLPREVQKTQSESASEDFLRSVPEIPLKLPSEVPESSEYTSNVAPENTTNGSIQVRLANLGARKATQSPSSSTGDDEKQDKPGIISSSRSTFPESKPKDEPQSSSPTDAPDDRPFKSLKSFNSFTSIYSATLPSPSLCETSDSPTLLRALTGGSTLPIFPTQVFGIAQIIPSPEEKATSTNTQPELIPRHRMTIPDNKVKLGRTRVGSQPPPVATGPSWKRQWRKAISVQEVTDSLGRKMSLLSGSPKPLKAARSMATTIKQPLKAMLSTWRSLSAAQPKEIPTNVASEEQFGTLKRTPSSEHQLTRTPLDDFIHSTFKDSHSSSPAPDPTSNNPPATESAFSPFKAFSQSKELTPSQLNPILSKALSPTTSTDKSLPPNDTSFNTKPSAASVTSSKPSAVSPLTKQKRIFCSNPSRPASVDTEDSVFDFQDEPFHDETAVPYHDFLSRSRSSSHTPAPLASPPLFFDRQASSTTTGPHSSRTGLSDSCASSSSLSTVTSPPAFGLDSITAPDVVAAVGPLFSDSPDDDLIDVAEALNGLSTDAHFQDLCVSQDSTQLSVGSSSCSTNSSYSPTLSISSGSSGASGASKRNRALSPSKLGPQQCQVCLKIFSNGSALAKHKLTHSDERRFVCNVCCKGFKRQDHLNGHMLTHRHKKPYECMVKNCRKSYCDARSLRRHEENHHNIRGLPPLSVTERENREEKRKRSKRTSSLPEADESRAVETLPGADNEVSHSTASSPTTPGCKSDKVATTGSPDTMPEALNFDTLLTSVDTVPKVSALVLPTSSDTLSGVSLPDTFSAATPPGRSQAQTTVLKIPQIPPPSQLTIPSVRSQHILTQDPVPAAVTCAPSFVQDSASIIQEQSSKEAPTPEALPIEDQGGISLKFITTYLPHWALRDESREIATDSPAIEIDDFPETSNGDQCSIITNPEAWPNTVVTSTSSEQVSTDFNQKPFPPAQADNGGSNISERTLKFDQAQPGEIFSSQTVSSSLFSMELCDSDSHNDEGTYEPRTSSTVEVKTKPTLQTTSLQQTTWKPFGVATASKSSCAAQSTITTMTATSTDTSRSGETIPRVNSTAHLSSVQKAQIAKKKKKPETEKKKQPKNKSVDDIPFEKHVPCTVCPRRFINIPALNGHMRLHGGFYKKHWFRYTRYFHYNKYLCFCRYKELEARRAEKRGSTGPRLKTASVSVRQLIEAKINARLGLTSDRNNASRTSTTEAAAPTTPEGTDRLTDHEEAYRRVSMALDPNSAAAVLQHHNYANNALPNSVLTSNYVNSPPTAPSSPFTSSSCPPLSPQNEETDPHQLLIHSEDPLLSSTIKDISSNKVDLNSLPVVGNVLVERGGELHLIQAPPAMVHKLNNTTRNQEKDTMRLSGSISHKLTPESYALYHSAPNYLVDDFPRYSRISGAPGIAASTASALQGKELLQPSGPSKPGWCSQLEKKPREMSPYLSHKSRLRPRKDSSCSEILPYTAGLMLDPNRSGEGLFARLRKRKSSTHEGLDGCETEGIETDHFPHINVGARFQCVLPKCKRKPYSWSDGPDKNDVLLWHPSTAEKNTEESVETYLRFASSDAVTGGGQNQEYALHILHITEGDMLDAMSRIMKPKPRLPPHHCLLTYEYPLSENWTIKEMNDFVKALIRYSKNWSLVSKAVGNQSPKNCIQFYYIWKLFCCEEYNWVKSLWEDSDKLKCFYLTDSQEESEAVQLLAKKIPEFVPGSTVTASDSTGEIASSVCLTSENEENTPDVPCDENRNESDNTQGKVSTMDQNLDHHASGLETRNKELSKFSLFQEEFQGNLSIAEDAIPMYQQSASEIKEEDLFDQFSDSFLDLEKDDLYKLEGAKRILCSIKEEPWEPISNEESKLIDTTIKLIASDDTEKIISEFDEIKLNNLDEVLEDLERTEETSSTNSKSPLCNANTNDHVKLEVESKEAIRDTNMKEEVQDETFLTLLNKSDNPVKEEVECPSKQDSVQRPQRDTCFCKEVTEEHVPTSSDSRLFVCAFADCSASFNSKAALNGHIRIHGYRSSPPPNSNIGAHRLFANRQEYACKTCGKTFGRLRSRTAHMKTHKLPTDQQIFDSSESRQCVGLPNANSDTQMPLTLSKSSDLGLTYGAGSPNRGKSGNLLNVPTISPKTYVSVFSSQDSNDNIQNEVTGTKLHIGDPIGSICRGPAGSLSVSLSVNNTKGISMTVVESGDECTDECVVGSPHEGNANPEALLQNIALQIPSFQLPKTTVRASVLMTAKRLTKRYKFK